MRRLRLTLDGVGIGWRPETAWLISQRPRVRFSEVIAETIDPAKPPAPLLSAIERGLQVVTHGVALSLGGAAEPERKRIDRLARVAKVLRSPLVSEHVAFCRARAVESSHFLPVAYTRAQLAILVDNVRRVQDALPVPFALENVAAPFVWPSSAIAEADFLAELVERTGASLLLDAANVHANLVNYGGDLDSYLDRLPLDRIAYIHVAGGAVVEEMWRDTHAHPITPPILATLARVLARTGPRPLLLERDDHYGTRENLERELDDLEAILAAAPAVVPRPPARELHVLPPASRPLLESQQLALLEAVLGGARPHGFDRMQIEETRAIVRRKQAVIDERRGSRRR
jgi:uncharacterized protein (UPF0276 family)